VRELAAEVLHEQRLGFFNARHRLTLSHHQSCGNHAPIVTPDVVKGAR
jgi:hypothetical protein